MKTPRLLTLLAACCVALISDAAPPALALDIATDDGIDEVRVNTSPDSLLGFDGTGQPARIAVSGSLNLTGSILTAAGGTLAALGDVTISSPTGGQLLRYDSGAGKWSNWTHDLLSSGGSYANPSWLTSLSWSKITSRPATLAGYGITDAQPLDADLTAVAALSTASFGRSLLSLPDAVYGRHALELVDSVTGIQQIIAIEVTSVDSLAGQYIDLEDGAGAVRLWFNNGAATPPDTPSGGRLLQVSYDDSDDVIAVADKMAAAMASDSWSINSPGFTPLVNASADQAGDFAPPASPAPNFAVAELTPGQAAGRTLTAFDGAALYNVDASTLSGLVAADFAGAAHTHNLSDLTGVLTGGQLPPMSASERGAVPATGTPSGRILQDNGAFIERPRPRAGSGTTAYNSTALGDAAGLTAPVGTGSYTFQAEGFYSTTNTTEGIGLAVDGPSATSINICSVIATTAAGSVNLARNTAWDAVHMPVSSAGNVNQMWRVYGSFTASASGTLAIRVRAETGGGQNVTIHPGAILVVSPAN